jgi:anti-anti-sigma regulatory factor
MKNNNIQKPVAMNGLKILALSLKEYRQKINSTFSNDPALNNELFIDLSGVNTLVLQELSSLLFYQQYAEQRNGNIVLTNVSSVLYEFFELTRTDRCFIIRPVLV